MLPFVVIHAPAGGRAFEATPLLASVRYDSAAVGGFGSFEAAFAGDVRKQFVYLGVTRVLLGSATVWEGQLEDVTLSLSNGNLTTTIQCFGLRRLLDETDVRRIWSKRDVPWQEIAKTYNPGGGMAGPTYTPQEISFAAGAFDTSDLTRQGLKFAGVTNDTVPAATNWQRYALFTVPSGLTLVRYLFDVTVVGAGWFASASDSSDGSAFAALLTQGATAKASQSVAATSGSKFIAFGAIIAPGNVVGGSNVNHVDFENIRMLGTTLTEDATGGLYGGSILRDLIALVPGLTIGVIEDGSDYTIQALERAVRDTALSVLQEVAGYYTREWAVWDNGAFDWKTRNLDEPQWIITLDTLKELELTGSIDGLARTVYVLYTDAASGIDAEQSALATDQRNPYLRQGRTKDVLVQPGFPMTSNTAGQLASTVAADIAVRPLVSGRCVLHPTAMVSHAAGAAKPAAMIRGGDNILLPELPKSDPLIGGRDGETLFHVVASDVDLTAGTVTLELEGQQSRQSVIMARLAQVTRTLTG